MIPNLQSPIDDDLDDDLDDMQPTDPDPRSLAFRRRPRRKRGTLSLDWPDAELLDAEAKRKSTAWRPVTYMDIARDIIAAHCRKVREDAASKKAKAKPAAKPAAKKPAAKKPAAKKPAAKKPAKKGGRR